MDGVDAVEQVFTKHPLFYHCGYVLVCCRNQADIYRDHFVASQPHHIAALEYREQLGLERQGQVAYFVHKQ